MGLKRSAGNMYSWVTHTHAHLAGACPHGCSYCYVTAMARRFPNMKALYSGPLRLIESEFDVNYGEWRTIFVEHLNDLFAKEVPREFIKRVLEHCNRFPKNTYVFQTKNPMGYSDFYEKLPPSSILGTTIETNRWEPEVMGKASQPIFRFEEMAALPIHFQTFVTIEPILDFDLEELVDWMVEVRPKFVNIGADSKGHGLPEPSGDKVRALLNALKSLGIEVRQKSNLTRLLGKEMQL